MDAHRLPLLHILLRAAGIVALALTGLLSGAALPDIARGQTAAQADAQANPLQVELESIVVEPPDREAELLVRRHLPLRVGQVVDPGVLLQARDELASTGLFNEVDIYTTRGSRPGGVNAVVAAVPSHRFHLETGLGFEPLRGWYLNILGVRRTGLFGRGGTARLSFRSGLRASGLYGEMLIPGLLPNELDVLVGLDAFDETWTLYDLDKSYHQMVGRSRVLVGVQRRLLPDLALVVRTAYSEAHAARSLDPYDDTPSIPATDLLGARDRSVHLVGLDGELYRDRLDRLRPWQNGSWTGFALRAAAPDKGPVFGGAEFDARAAFPVAGTRAAAFRVRAAYASPGTPYFLRYVVGGVGSLRGFAPAGLSGRLGARALWQASAEWRHPLAGSDPRRPRVTGTIFMDVGDHWTADGRRFGVSSSVGYGALFRIPWIETINAEVAYPLSSDPTGSPVQVSLSLARSF